MNLSESLKEPIRNRDMETKVEMLCNFKRRQMASQVNTYIFFEWEKVAEKILKTAKKKKRKQDKKNS